MFFPRVTGAPTGTSSLPVGKKATRGRRYTGTAVTPPMASAARSTPRMGRPPRMRRSPVLSVLPRGRTWRPGTTGSSGDSVSVPSGPKAACSMGMTASKASGKSSPVSARS